MADAGRVIAGTARGVRLAAPGEGTRPLGDRVKQTLFAILEPRPRGRARRSTCTPAAARAAIEALSRGAARAVLVEKDGGACRTIAENLRRDAARGPARAVVRRDVVAWLADPAGAAADGPFDLVLVDPPYADTAGARARARARRRRTLAPDAVVVAKHFWRDAPPARVGMLAAERERRFGETALTFYRPATRRRDEEADEA